MNGEGKMTLNVSRRHALSLGFGALAFGAGSGGWHFLTGDLAAVREVARRYGVAVSGRGDAIDHTLLTSLIDQRGTLRVQYLGYRFDPEEFRRDLVGLVNEP